MSKANQKVLKNVSLKDNNEAVSPVMGTILMVAVTIILAAVIAAFTFGFTGAMPKAPQVSYFSIERTNDGIMITNMAPTIANVSNVQVMVGSETTAYSGTGADGLGVLYNTCTIPSDYVGIPLTGPCPITIKASINGAPIQVIESTQV